MFVPRLLKPGAAAPDFSVLDQTGQTHTLETLTANGATGLLVFYYHYQSQTCRNYLGSIAAQTHLLRERNVNVLALNPLDWEGQRQMALDLQLPFPVGYDPMSRFARLYGTCLYKSFWNARAVYGIRANRKIIYTQAGFSSIERVTHSIQ